MRRLGLILFVVLAYALTIGAIVSHAADPVPLITTGPAAERLTVAIVSEGYTESGKAAFISSATSLAAGILRTQPFGTNAGRLNFDAVFVPSEQSGISSETNRLDTAFSLQSPWAGQDRLIDGILVAQRLARVLVPLYGSNRVAPILLANTSKRAGSGGGGYVVVTRSSDNWQVAVHELGHCAGLQDEYETANGPSGMRAFRAPNVAVSLDDLPWADLLTPGIPVPTKESSTYAGKIGVFPGAMFSATSAWRPYLDCAMRTQGRPFCPVCTRQITRWILNKP